MAECCQGRSGPPRAGLSEPTSTCAGTRTGLAGRDARLSDFPGVISVCLSSDSEMLAPGDKLDDLGFLQGRMVPVALTFHPMHSAMLESCAGDVQLLFH